MNNFLAQANQYQSELISLFRHFHQNPEPSHGEIKTNAAIRDYLNKYNIRFLAPKDNITIALISGEQGNPSNKTIGIRCDTDALQMQEETGLPYASSFNGLMHGCGHDAHIAMGLLAARILNQNKANFSGNAKIIFQPAEEGELGAQEVIATGLVDDVSAFLGIHVWSLYPTKTIHVSPGPVTASTDMFKIIVRGKAGHGAYPHLCHDAVTAGASIVQALQYIPSRFVSPMEPIVLTIGSFHGGTRCNIIAGEAILEGTTRSFLDEVREEVHSDLINIAKQTAAAHHCTAEINIIKACSATYNSEMLCDIVRSASQKLVSEEAIGPQAPGMVGDDFAEYKSIAPCCYVQLGIADATKGTDVAHHHGCFKVDEEALPLGVALMCQFAIEAMEAIN